MIAGVLIIVAGLVLFGGLIYVLSERSAFLAVVLTVLVGIYVALTFYATAHAGSCVRTDRVVTLHVSSERWPHIADHIADVRDRYSRRLVIDRRGADQRRARALEGYATMRGRARDEYPPAMTRQGGARAHVRLVPLRENASQGAWMGNRLRRYCNGQSFRLVPR